MKYNDTAAKPGTDTFVKFDILTLLTDSAIAKPPACD